MRRVLLFLLLCLLPFAAHAQEGIGGGQDCSVQGPYSGIAGGPCAGAASLPILGNNVQEPTANNSANTFSAGTYFVAPATGTYTTFHVYASCSSAASAWFGVYPATSAPSASGTTLISQGTFTCPATAAWVTGSITVPVVQGNTYWLAARANATNFNLFWTTSTGTAAYEPQGGSSGAFPTTNPTVTNQAGLYSLYLSKP